MTQAHTTAFAVQSWRDAAFARAARFIRKAGRPVCNRELAEGILMDPRGLRQFMRRNRAFIIKDGPGLYSRTEPWYSLRKGSVL